MTEHKEHGKHEQHHEKPAAHKASEAGLRECAEALLASIERERGTRPLGTITADAERLRAALDLGK